MRETRHLLVAGLPENIKEDKLFDYFKRYGRIERVKLLSKKGSDGRESAAIAFVGIRSAQTAHNSLNIIGDCQVQTTYSEAAVMSSVSRSNEQGNSSSRQSGHRHSHPNESIRNYERNSSKESGGETKKLSKLRREFKDEGEGKTPKANRSKKTIKSEVGHSSVGNSSKKKHKKQQNISQQQSDSKPYKISLVIKKRPTIS